MGFGSGGIGMRERLNIFDRRHTGAGKTRDSIKFITSEVIQKRATITIMYSYKNLEEIFENLSDEIKERSLIFKGRTKPDVCEKAEFFERLYHHIRPRYDCITCKFSCLYKKQITWLEKRTREQKTKTDISGFAIFTVPKNLPFILYKLKNTKITIIIDDVPLSDVITPSQTIPTKELFEISNYIELIPTIENSIIQIIIKLLIDRKSQEIPIEDQIKAIIEKNQHIIKFELLQIENEVESGITKAAHIPNFSIIYTLQSVVQNDFEFKIYQPSVFDNSHIKIIHTNSDLFKYPIRYLNATPSPFDIMCMEELGKYQVSDQSANYNEKFVVYQIIDKRYTKSTLIGNSPIHALVDQTIDVFSNTLRFLDVPLLFFCHKEVYEKKYQEKMEERDDCRFVKFFDPLASSTNEFRDHPISIILGTPIRPPVAFQHPFNSAYQKTAEEIVIEIKKNNSNHYKKAIYPVRDELVSLCIVADIEQMLGRSLRLGDRHYEKKISLLFTNTTLTDDDYLKQNGAIIKKISLNSNEKAEKFFRQFKRECQNVLKIAVIEKVCADCDLKILKETISLEKICQQFAEENSPLFSVSWFKEELNKAYITEKRLVDHDGKKIITSIIIEKRRI